MKILNLYAGIGGNRKLWGDDHEITAVENVPGVAKIYQDFFPNDTVLVEDAHQYLLDHFEEFDFIWSSPPCPTHSMFRKTFSISNGAKPVFPDMKLYEEILLLKHYFAGRWCVENVTSYYEPLISPVKIQRHYFWTNFLLPATSFERGTTFTKELEDNEAQIKKLQNRYGFVLAKYSLSQMQKRTILRNCVEPEVGLHILNCALEESQLSLL